MTGVDDGDKVGPHGDGADNVSGMPPPDLLQLAPSLYRLRVPGGRAHLLNCYLWVDRDGVTLIDTGWPDSAALLSQALAVLGRRPDRAFNTDRLAATRSVAKLAATGAKIAGFGHGEAVVADACERIAAVTDPFADGPHRSDAESHW